MTAVFEEKPSSSFSVDASGNHASQSDGLIEHESYYFEIVIFQVEDTLFKVPRHHFEQDSVVFRDMFTLSPAPGTVIDGSTREKPLRLDGIAKADFHQFLKIICPKHFHHHETLSFSEWVSVLKLSTMWEFQKARELAISSMTPMTVDPVEKIEIARAYNVNQWYWPALRQLAEESTRPLMKDVDRLGVEFSLRVAELRGKVAGHRIPRKKTVSGSATLDFVGELFHDEVKDVPLLQCDQALRDSCSTLISSTLI